MLKKVVLPAPFGPMSETMDPRGMSKSTLLTAEAAEPLGHATRADQRRSSAELAGEQAPTGGTGMSIRRSQVPSLVDGLGGPSVPEVSSWPGGATLDVVHLHIDAHLGLRVVQAVRR